MSETVSLTIGGVSVKLPKSFEIPVRSLMLAARKDGMERAAEVADHHTCKANCERNACQDTVAAEIRRAKKHQGASA